MKSAITFTQIIKCGEKSFCHPKDHTLKELQLASHVMLSKFLFRLLLAGVCPHTFLPLEQYKYFWVTMLFLNDVLIICALQVDHSLGAIPETDRMNITLPSHPVFDK